MDINQSALSGYQPNNKNNRTVSSSSSASDRTRVTDSASAVQAGKTPELKEGQMLKGQILDIRYNEVKVQLEPGKQVISARLSGDVSLSIGQEANFQVTEESSEHLVLKYMPLETASPNDTTIMKALTASGLSLSDRNRSLVSELLNHRMPIDKQTLQSLARFSALNREASPLTLVLMYKNKLPITASNIKQFEAYQNGTHQLLNDIRKVSENITDIIRTDIRESTSQNNTSPLSNAIRMNGNLIDLLYNRTEASSTDILNTPMNQLLSKDAFTGFRDAVSQQFSNLAQSSEAASNSFMKQVADGDLSLTDTVRLLNSLSVDSPTGYRQSEAQTVQDILTQLSTQSMASDNPSSTTTSSASEDVSKLLIRYLSQQDTSFALSSVLTSEETVNLSNLLISLQNSDMVRDDIAQGKSSLKDTLSLIADQLPLLDKASAETLLRAPEYSKLLEEAFLQKWTITPEKVSKKDSITDLYQQLKDDLEKLSNLTKSYPDSEEKQRIDTPVNNMKENLQFMKDLNDAFTYLQLPVQFKDQTAHTDLYIMTRKKAITDNKEKLSVLLHLDMSNLGPVNVYLQMNPGKRIQADFYIEDAFAGLLMKENLPSLTDALEKKGYSLDADVKGTYKKPDFIKDFIEQNSLDKNIMRYSFDIRT